MKLPILSQLFTLAAAAAPAVAPHLTAEQLVAAIVALGLGCLLHADYARRPRLPLTVAASRRASEPLTLAA